MGSAWMCVDISFAGTGHSAQLCLAHRFESEKFFNPANQADPFFIVNTDISADLIILI
jgi:hypothetical protein